MEAHLAECESCAEHLRQIRITVAVTGRIREEDLARPCVMTSWTSTAAGGATVRQSLQPGQHARGGRVGMTSRAIAQRRSKFPRRDVALEGSDHGAGVP
jgi:hypothetical protein